MSTRTSIGTWFLEQPLPAKIAGVALVAWLVMLCVLPDPRPLGAPDWTVQLVQRAAGIAEPRARFLATSLLRGAGVGLIGVLLAIAMSGWKSRAAVPALLIAAPLLGLAAKWINFGALPIWPQLVFILLVAFLGGLAGLALRRNWAALGALAVVTGGLAAWGASTGVCNDLFTAWQGTARHVLDAAADVPTWNRYAEPQSGRGEEVHFMRLEPDAKGRATALLVAPDGQQAVSLSWRTAELPCFTLWKNQGGLADGYVTGLEPGTNYPNPRSFEEAQGRVVALAPHAGVTFDLALEHLTGAAVSAERARIAASAASTPRIDRAARPGWSRG